MAITAAVKLVDITRRRRTIRVLITASGSYTTGGDTLNLTTATNPNKIQGGQFGALPDDSALIYIPGGYIAEFIAGSNLTNGKIKVWSAAGAELAAANYPAVLTGTAWEFEFSGKLWAGM